MASTRAAARPTGLRSTRGAARRRAGRGALVVVAGLGACGPAPAARAPEPPRDGAIVAELGADPATGATTLDGLVVWPAPLDEAPPAVQQRLELAALAVTAFATAPAMRSEYQRDPEAWRRELEASQPHFDAYRERVEAWVEAGGEPDTAALGLPADQARLYRVVLQLVEEHARARYLATAGLGWPAFGSCYDTPDEAFGDALSDTLALARECVALAATVRGPLATNAAACQRRAAWSEGLIATGVRGVCEPPMPDER